MSLPQPENRGPRPRPATDAPAPVLRRHSDAAGPPPDAADAPFAAARLTALTHELANLLDGSMRCLGLAQRSLTDQVSADPARAIAVTPDLARRIDTVHAALTQMSELVRSAMTGVSPDARLGRRPGLVEGWTLEDALRHASDIMTPIAQEAGVELRLAIDPSVGALRSASIYATVAAGIRNAIESIQQTGRGRGEVHIAARVIQNEKCPGGDVLIEITDDGVGPPQLPAGQERRVFELGFSTKAGRGPHRSAAGIGLAMVRDAVAALGGSVHLLMRDDAAEGAVLRILYPVRAASSPKVIGGNDRC